MYHVVDPFDHEDKTFTRISFFHLSTFLSFPSLRNGIEYMFLSRNHFLYLFKGRGKERRGSEEEQLQMSCSLLDTIGCYYSMSDLKGDK